MVENSGKNPFDSQIRIVRDGRQVYAGPARQAPVEGGRLALTGKLKLSEKMSPGDYYLGVLAGGTAQWTDFQILP
jgi:hypothetical protein